MTKTKLNLSKCFGQKAQESCPDNSYLVMNRVEEDIENSCHEHLPMKGRWFSVKWSNKKDTLGEEKFINCVESERRLIKHQQTRDLYERRAGRARRVLLCLVGDNSEEALESRRKLQFKLANLESTIKPCYDYCRYADREHCTAQQLLLDETGHAYDMLKNVHDYENM